MTEEEWLNGLRQLSHGKIVQAHFGLQEKIKKHYKLRAQGNNLKKAISLCEQQIALAPLAMAALRATHKAHCDEYRAVIGRDIPNNEFYPPSHHGYRQYAVILKRAKNFEKLAEIEAKKKSEGWAD